MLLALRGPDGMNREGVAIKDLVKFIRRCVLVHADPHWRINPKETFFRLDYPTFDEALRAALKDHDAVPHHFTMHLVHAIEVVAFMHPARPTRDWAFMAYLAWADAFHMKPRELRPVHGAPVARKWH